MITETGKKLKEISQGIDSASAALDELNKSVISGGLKFGTLLKSIESSNLALKNTMQTVGQLSSNLLMGLDFGVIEKSFNFLSNSVSSVVSGITAVGEVLDSTGKGMDAVTGYSRALNKEMFDVTAKFNGSFAAAKAFGDYINSNPFQFANVEFGSIDVAERKQAFAELGRAGIPLENLNSVIKSSAGTMDLLNTAILQSKSLGMDMPSYMGLMSDSMITQGLSTQQAAEQLALFGDISESTNIRVDKVSSSLQNISRSFSRLGLTASFGAPILEGFAESLNNMGLGFENAIDLTGTLSNALVGLTSNYSAAYLTFQRGGLDIGGGEGALGASIGLRAEMLREERGEGQGDLATKLAGALKDTVASFTGGQIITVEEAATSPELQQAFYTQTQLLKNLYNINDTADQDRILELLKELEGATRTGDRDLQQSLGKDIQEMIGVRQETMSYEEKTAAYTAASFVELQHLNKNIIDGFNLSSDSLAERIGAFQETAVEEAAKLIPNEDNSIKEMTNNIKNLTYENVKQLQEKYNASGIVDKISDDISDTMSQTSKAFLDAFNKSDIAKSLGELVSRMYDNANISSENKNKRDSSRGIPDR